ncbi:MAG: hypothetical protein CVU57_18980 [Deltaproteobacteria bacterium HGW-Deltaproteobacteria-15]|nr:MAG: hypothetical protein CVU57_18980 [Deltaproteobacteria bacterium HGW-Deltaproteobacteria-15]
MKRLCTGKRSRVSVFGVFAFAVLLHLMAMPASSSQQVASLTEFTGMVIVQSQGDWGVKPEKGLPLYSMDKVVTKTGTAVVTFKDGAVLQIRANSNLLIEEQEKTGSVIRNLRLLLGKVLFKTGVGSKAQTNLQTPTAVVGLRGTAGTLSIGLDGKNYIQFTEGGASYTLGEFLSGVAKDVPPELADLNPAQRAAFAAAAAADQAKKAAEAAKDGTVTEKQAAFAAAVAAEKAAMEAMVAAEAMLNSASPEIVQQAQAAIDAANLAIKAAQDAQRELLNQGVQPPPETYTPLPDGETGFDVETPSTITQITISTTITLPPTTLSQVKMSSRTPPGFLDTGTFSGSIDSTTGVGAIALEGQYTTLLPIAASPLGGSMTDGGAFEGYVGGVEGSWSGVFASIFVGENGSAGFLTGSLSGGGVYGSLLATGPMYKETVGTTTLLPGNLQYAMNYDPMNPTFYDPAGHLLTGMPVPDFTSISVTNSSSLILGGAHGDADIRGITLTDGTMIGVWTHESPSGTYQNPGYESSSGKWGYNGGSYFMLGDLTLTDDGTGHVGVKGTVNYMDPLYTGTIGVGYAGAYSSGLGQGYSAGTYTLRRLAFSGVGSGSFYKQDQYGAVQATGDLPGILGGTQALPLPGETSFTAMGAYDNPDGAEIFQQQYVGMSGSDYLFLFTAGQTGNGTVQNGRVRGILAGPGGIYHLSGSVGGAYYEDAGMWEANGAIRSFANLTGDAVNGRIGGGSLGSTMTIDVTTRELISPADNPDWGIFFRSYEGTYQTPPPSNWSAKFGWSTSEPAYLLGDISGGAVSGSAFTASLSNIVQITPQAIVHAEGTLFGGHSEGVWKGVGSGQWVREPLLFSSVLDYKALRMAPGVFYESDFGRSLSGQYDSYEYEYFVANSGSLVFGYKDFDPYNDRSYEEVYLPSGHSITASEWPPYRVSTRFAPWTVGSLSPGHFTTLPSGGDWYREWYEQHAGYMALDAGSISAIMGGTRTFWGATSSSPASMILVGSYLPKNGNYAAPSVFRFDADSSIYTSGAYKGDVVGRINSEDVDGLFYAVYVDPNQKAGILKGEFSGTGTVCPEIGMWKASGSLYPTQRASNVGFDPAALADNMVGGVMFGWTNGHFGTSGSYIEGDGAGVTRSIKGQDWGTYRFGFTIDNWIKNLSSEWSARVTGMGEFGTHARLGQTELIHDVGRWLSNPVTGSALDNKIDASYTGKYLTYRQYGTLSGDIIGTYNTANSTWQGFSAGAWKKQQDLSFAAIVQDGDIMSEFRVSEGNHNADNGSFYEYTYYDVLNFGRSKEYDASTNTTIHTQYYGDGWKEQWKDVNGAPSYIEDNWSGSLLDILANGSTLFNSDEPIQPDNPYCRFEHAGWIEGILGGLEDPWSATLTDPAEIVILGEYDRDEQRATRSVFGFDFYSYNPYFSNPDHQSRTVWNQANNTEYGAFRGYAGGTIVNNMADPGSQDAIDGMLIGLYRDHLGNTGVLMGGFVGKGYTEPEVWETTSGAMYPIPLGTTSILAADFYDSAVESYSNYLPADTYATWGLEPDMADNDIHSTYRESVSLGIPGQTWTIAQVIDGGCYVGTPTDVWTARYDFTDPGDNIRRLGTVDGAKWSGNKIEGKNSGAWVSYSDAVTGVHGGALKGTFDPDALTYQTVAHIATLTSGKFLQMINTGQIDALTRLNIPCIQVGSTNLQLMSTDQYFNSVNMNDVRFFAYSTGADPRIWATNSVTGSFNSTPPVNHTAELISTGGPSSLNAGFTVKNWSNGKWGASVSGYGSLSRTDIPGSTDIEFKGGAAGTYKTDRTFSGTGSGVAKKSTGW